MRLLNILVRMELLQAIVNFYHFFFVKFGRILARISNKRKVLLIIADFFFCQFLSDFNKNQQKNRPVIINRNFATSLKTEIFDRKGTILYSLYILIFRIKFCLLQCH